MKIVVKDLNQKGYCEKERFCSEYNGGFDCFWFICKRGTPAFQR